MVMRKCKICGIEKELNIDNFYVRTQRGRKTFRWDCKLCNTAKSVKYKQDHKEERAVYDKQYRLEHKKELIEYGKQYYLEHKAEDNTYSKNYQDTHKEELRASRREREKRLRKTDPLFKMRKDISRLISFALNKQNSNKRGSSCLDYLPYTINELKEHLEKQFESWMTWENRGVYYVKTWNDNNPTTWTWQIDHIIPQSKLSYTTMTDNNFQICWALSNLRPLSAKQNLLDGVYRKRHINE
jgi:hypothetical protein